MEIDNDGAHEAETLGPQKAVAGLVIAAVGAGITAALASGDIFPLDAAWQFGLTIAAAVLTPLGVAVGVYQTANK